MFIDNLGIAHENVVHIPDDRNKWDRGSRKLVRKG